MTMMEMTGHNTAPCGAPRTGILGEDASLSMQTTAPLLLRNAADQRSVPLRIDSRRVPKMMLSWSTVSRALARSTKTAVVRCCGASRRGQALRRSNGSRMKSTGQQPDVCRVDWDPMAP
ncbi:hypothetical protein TcYC6_0023390 [Trypanosoma cruzi]|nr:hypothetical protein TcYC6_0023390 [Trypanosoma cruzi]